MITEQAADLVARVRTVPALALRVGLALGGQQVDPNLIKVPLPAAWVMYLHDQVDEVPGASSSPYLVPATQVMLATFGIIIYVPYISEADMLATQLPLLELVIKAVKLGGGQAPSGFRWRYIGQKLQLVDSARLAYEQQYTLNFPM